ncbi:MAG: CotH kinase family protein [Candidatus Cloacimonadales bacterium]|nr:CotH kinase family protein [Candidatus Cloacimonadales bacterium]
MQKILLILSLLFFLMRSHFLLSQAIYINEVMSSNSNTIFDEDGDTPDWIELYNAETMAVNLDGFGFTDDVADPFKWEFPDISIPSQDFLLVFASNKNRSIGCWETIINWGDNWKYFVGTEEPPTDWLEIDFDDSSWSEGPSGFGYGDDDDATIIPATISCYVRHIFQISDLSNIAHALLHVDYDDGFVAYLNEVEIARENIGQIGYIPAYDETVTTDHEAQIYQDGLPEMFSIDNWQALLVNGDNVLAIQVHNVDISSSDLSLIPFLTLGYHSEPLNPVGVAAILEPTLPRLHTNFKISGEGETLLLSDALGTSIDEIDVGSLATDISFGRQPDGSDAWFMFNEATPDSSNTTTGYLSYATDPVFDIEGGFYSGSFTFEFIDIPVGETIFYSLDGSLPDETFFQYTDPVTLDSTVVVRARAFAAGKIPSRIITKSFFINLDPILPVISLVTDPINFFDENYGIYVMGPNAQPDYPYYGANFWEDWERPINIQMFEPDETDAFQIDAGVKIFGNYSRGHPQKSLAIYARDQYGYSSIDYQIFPDKDIDEFNNIILRNSGNDWEWSMMRDGLMTSLLKDTGLDRQAYRPSAVYINGEYWGILNIREKINEYFIEGNHDVDPDNLELLEDDSVVIYGDNDHYLALLDFLENNDISLPENYDYVCTQMDMENYLNYMVAELYYCNEDWPGRNIKFWRENTEGSKWKWIIFDLDFGLGYWGNAEFDMLEFALEPNGPSYPNPPWSTFLFRKLVTNNQFVHDLANLFADYMNSIFNPNHYNSVQWNLHDYLEPEMQNHVLRWDHTMTSWENEMLVMEWFMEDRIDFMKVHIMDHFNYPGMANIYLDISPEDTGIVQVNTLEIDDFPWTGEYFLQNSVVLTGLASPGWEFAGWTGDIVSDSTSITLDMAQDFSFIAWFEPVGSFADSIVFNEINYNSAADFDSEDWVEIYNRSQNDIDMSGWQFKDSEDNHAFEVPAGFVLPSDEYFILCRDTLAFQTFFPGVTNFLGNFDFGLSSNGELIRLFDHTGSLIDSVEYDDNSPWPVEPDGNGPTLALLNPNWDNSLAENWAASSQYGTPGEINDVYVSADEEIVAISHNLQLLQNFPNPFNPSTKISFSLSNESKVNLSIYNIKGQLVKILANEFFDKGIYTVTWDGEDNTGKAVASGLYFYKLISDDNTKSRKMLLLK